MQFDTKYLRTLITSENIVKWSLFDTTAIIIHKLRITCVNVVHNVNVGTFDTADCEFMENGPVRWACIKHICLSDGTANIILQIAINVICPAGLKGIKVS